VSKITKLEIQKKNKNRVNVYVDDVYSFSLLENQIIDLGISKLKDYTASDIDNMKKESVFGILYQNALFFCVGREHSHKEVRDYLKRKCTKIMKDFYIEDVTDAISKVEIALANKDYINDERFCDFWIEYRNVKKGISRKKIILELRAKGVDDETIEKAILKNSRDDKSEIKKVILRKRNKYEDDNKLIRYLLSQGFSFSDIKEALNDSNE
jgi:regulatory protein